MVNPARRLDHHPYRNVLSARELRTQIPRYQYGVLVLSGAVSFFFLALAANAEPFSRGLLPGSVGLMVVTVALFGARIVYRRTPRAVRVTATTVELDYRDGSRSTIPADDLRVVTLGTAIQVSGAEAHLLESGAFASRDDRLTFVRELNRLLGYDVLDPVGELVRRRRHRTPLR